MRSHHGPTKAGAQSKGKATEGQKRRQEQLSCQQHLLGTYCISNFAGYTMGKTGAMDRKTQLQETKILSMRHMDAGGEGGVHENLTCHSSALTSPGPYVTQRLGSSRQQSYVWVLCDREWIHLSESRNREPAEGE